MSVTEAKVLEALKRVKGPDLESNIVDLGLVSGVLVKNDKVYFSITIDPSRAEELEPLRQAAAKVVSDLEGVEGATAVLTAERSGDGAGAQPAEHPRVTAARQRGSAPASRQPAAPPPQQAGKPRAGEGIPGVRHLIAVASGKGGVGKSTTAVNLALGLQANGLKVGVLDADIYGPSQPRLLGLAGRPQQGANGKLQPMSGYGLKTMSMGFLVEEGTPIIWRGPMVVSALNQMLREVNWGELDAIIIDMPPGTGDVQLTMAQQVPLSGAVIVSTPQDLALIDARKGLAMFQRVDVPVLGIVENMSFFICPKCGERSDIFGHGGAAAEAEKLGVPFLGGVPLHMDIRSTSDAGQPIVVTAPESEHAKIYTELASRVWAEVAAAAGTLKKPELSVNPANNVLTVTFADGDTYQLSAEMLRVMSPSAEVQGHTPSQRVTVGGKRHVTIGDLRPVGSYAVRIVFSDGHDTGLFSWDYLEQLGREKDARWAEYEAELAQKGLSRD
ncbi:MAG: iron-sulfur cluster carrier protein ApbC [Alphaproteobacteria bacterium]|nr:iron-sulfur cluster carrier protein ApbC [Alphaproteobacteria bacterium]